METSRPNTLLGISLRAFDSVRHQRNGKHMGTSQKANPRLDEGMEPYINALTSQT